MAITAGTVQPIAAAPGARGTSSVAMATIPCDPSDAFLPGDILAINAATRDVSVAATPVAAAGTIFGVAMCKSFTSAATIDRNGQVNDDLINVALAVADARFAGNVVTGTATDETGVYVDNIRVKLGLIRTDAGGGTYFAIEQSSTGVDVVYPLEYVTPQFDTTGQDWQYGREAGVGMLNPRVIFMFLYNATVFGTAIA